MASSHERPPKRLAGPLVVNPCEWKRRDVYDLVTSLVIPRPVAWVSTVSPDGRRNLAPYSYFNLAADHPPHVIFSSIGAKDTLRNIQATGEFVVNLAGRNLLWQLDTTAAPLPYGQDEFSLAGVTAVPSLRIGAPRVAQARAQFECELAGLVSAGNGHLVIGRVVCIHVSESIWHNGRVAPELYDPVIRLSRCYGSLAHEFTAEEEPSPHVLVEAE